MIPPFGGSPRRAERRPRISKEIRARRGLVVDAGDQVFALEDAHAVARANEPDLVAGLAWVEHLVARLEPLDVGADRGDDAGGAVRGLVDGHDQAGGGFGLVERLDDDVVVERLDGDVEAGNGIEHARKATAPRPRTA